MSDMPEFKAPAKGKVQLAAPKNWRIEIDEELGLAYLFDADSGGVAIYRKEDPDNGNESEFGYRFLCDLLDGEQAAGVPRDVQYMANRWEEFCELAETMGFKRGSQFLGWLKWKVRGDK